MRELNGRWLVVKPILSTDESATGSRRVTLPAGTYRVQVIAKSAKFDVTVDK